MINVVLFDLGNVILPVDGHRMAKKLTQHSSLSVDEILGHFNKHELMQEFETGVLTNEGFFQKICSSCGISGMAYEDFLGFFNDIFEEDSRVVTLIENLKQTVKLGMISNTNAIHSHHLMRSYNLFSHFDKVWFSNEVGLRKPDPAIYNLALNHFGSKPEQTVFIDDLEPNIEGARKLGIHSILFKNYDQLIHDLEKLGVKRGSN